MVKIGLDETLVSHNRSIYEKFKNEAYSGKAFFHIQSNYDHICKKDFLQ